MNARVSQKEAEIVCCLHGPIEVLVAGTRVLAQLSHSSLPCPPGHRGYLGFLLVWKLASDPILLEIILRRTKVPVELFCQ